MTYNQVGSCGHSKCDLYTILLIQLYILLHDYRDGVAGTAAEYQLHMCNLKSIIFFMVILCLTICCYSYKVDNIATENARCLFGTAVK